MGVCRHQATVVLLMGELLPLLHPPQPAAVTEAGLQRFGQYLQAIADAVSTSTATSPLPEGGSLWSQAADVGGSSLLPSMSQGGVVLLQLAVEMMSVLSTQQAAQVEVAQAALMTSAVCRQPRPQCIAIQASLRCCAGAACLPPSGLQQAGVRCVSVSSTARDQSSRPASGAAQGLWHRTAAHRGGTGCQQPPGSQSCAVTGEGAFPSSCACCQPDFGQVTPTHFP